MYSTATKELRKALIKAIRALDNSLIGKADIFPRVELIDCTEGETLDKGQSLRTISFVVESIDNRSFAEASNIDSSISGALVGVATISLNGFNLLSITKQQGIEINEVGEGDRIIYRLRTTYEAFIEK
jgi:hypothetical protein